MLCPASAAKELPIFFAHTCPPSELYLAIKISSFPFEVSLFSPLPGLKSTVPKNVPVT
jgi:hypothetical protein